jgi:pilus assembly protein CpaE
MALNCALIGPNRDLVAQLRTAFDDLGGVQLARDLDKYPHQHELLRMVRSVSPQALFLDFSDSQKALEIIQTLQEEYPSLQIAVFHKTIEPQTLLRLMHLGIREYIAPPFEPDALAEVLIRLRDAALKNPLSVQRSNFVYSFLPSKPGSGTTTLATNVAVAMARQADTNVLLSDLDLNSGLIRFMLKLENDYTILDAARHSSAIDESLWPQLVCERGNLDVLITGKITTGVRLEAAEIRALIDYGRKNYSALCFDLSGNMEKYANEVMLESKRVFIVCTPEIPSLHLAREKTQYLQDQGIGDRISFILNRHSKTDVLQIEQIENVLGAPVYATFSNDYRGVNQALAEGREIAIHSELGRQIEKFSYRLLDREIPVGAQKKSKKELRGFGELFKFGVSRLVSSSNSEN